MSDLMSALSAICMAVIGTLCVVGVFYHRYDDTIGERLGMSLIGMWTLARLPVKVAQAFNQIDGDTESVHLMLHIGLASFALGMAWAKWRAHKRHGGHLFEPENSGV